MEIIIILLVLGWKGNNQDQGISTKVLSFIDNLVTKIPQRRLPRGKLIGRRTQLDCFWW